MTTAVRDGWVSWFVSLLSWRGVRLREAADETGCWELIGPSTREIPEAVLSELAEGLYYVPCDVVFNASDLVGTFTIVSTGKVEVSGSESRAQPFIDDLLFFTTFKGNDAVKLSGSNSRYSGFFYAPNGGLELSGSNSFFCGLFADTVKLNGSNNTFTGGECTPPDDDAA